ETNLTSDYNFSDVNINMDTSFGIQDLFLPEINMETQSSSKISIDSEISQESSDSECLVLEDFSD
ncbi:17822_t:CDS:1, partial [Cetraspora pellucida]